MKRKAKELVRCSWAGEGAMAVYHDSEWGVPTRDSRKLYEFLVLELSQAGLSWSTILKKREGYARAFSHWDIDLVAAYSAEKEAQLLQDPSIVRNKLKVAAAVENARVLVKMRDEEQLSFADYLWAFLPDGKPVVRQAGAPCASKTPLSDRISKDMKKRGFRFVGSTTVYSLLQSCGLVDDHDSTCWKRNT